MRFSRYALRFNLLEYFQEKYETSWNFIGCVTLGSQGMRDVNNLKVRILQRDSILSLHQKTDVHDLFLRTTMPRVTSARHVHIINGYLKFRSESRDGFRIRRWANASSRMHVEDTQASCKRTVWQRNANESKTMSRGNDQATSGRIRSRWRKRSGGETTLMPHSRPFSSSSRSSLSFYSIPVVKGAPRPVRGHARTISSRLAYESLHFFLRPSRYRLVHF